MSAYRPLLICLAGLLSGCDQSFRPADGFTILSDSQLAELGCALPKDMGDMAPPPTCAAAKGLGGENLLCVDFSSIPDQLLNNQSQLPAQLAGWDFTAKCAGKYWAISNHLLQITSFGTYADTCGFTLPKYDLTQAQYSQYNNITLSVVQKVDLDLGVTFPNQLAQTYNGTTNAAFLLTQTTGTLPEQQAIMTMNKQKLPAVMSNVVQYLLQVVSTTANASKVGLQISSIAVNVSQ